MESYVRGSSSGTKKRIRKPDSATRVVASERWILLTNPESRDQSMAGERKRSQWARIEYCGRWESKWSVFVDILLLLLCLGGEDWGLVLAELNFSPFHPCCRLLPLAPWKKKSGTMKVKNQPWTNK